MTAQDPEPIDVAALRRLVDGQDGSSAMRQNLVSWLNGHAAAVADAPEERDRLKQRIAALEIALRDTDNQLWGWARGSAYEQDREWRPLSVREQRRVNALLLGPADGAAREAEEVNHG